MPTFARISTRVTAVAAALAAGIALAPAASAQTEKENLDLSDLFTDQVITGSLSLGGNVARLVDVHSITQAVDELGRSIGSPRTVALPAGTGNGKLANYSCLPKSNGNRDFHQLPPVEIFQNDGKGKIQALFHTYRQDNARRLGGKGKKQKSTQYEVCGVGGVAPDGSRTRRAGVGITFADPTVTQKIGEA